MITKLWSTTRRAILCCFYSLYFWTFWKLLCKLWLISSQNLLLNFFGHVKESLCDIVPIFGTDLKKLNSKTICHLFALIKGNLSLTIWFIANKHLDYILCCMCFDLPHPIFQRIEGSSVIDGIDHNNSHGSFIVSLCDSFESLLSSSVPNLQSYFLPINFDGFDFEIDANCCQMRCHEIILAKS